MRGTDPGARAPIRAITDRPMGVIDLLDGAFSIVRHQPKVVIGLTAILVVPLALVEGLVLRQTFGDIGFVEMMNDPALADGSVQSISTATTVVSYLMGWVTVSLVGLFISVVVDDWNHGREPSVGSVVRRVGPRLPAWATAFVLIHLAEIFGSVLLLVPGLIAFVGFSLTSPVLAIENLGPVASMRRSLQLVRRGVGPILGLIILTALVSVPVDYAIELIPTVAVLFLGAENTWPLVSASSMLSSLVMLPVIAGSMTLAYLDLRFRTEGLDLEQRRQDLIGSS